MPKSKIKSANLYLPTEDVFKNVKGKDGQMVKRKVGKRLLLKGLTPDIINTGNLEMLQEFYDQHGEKLDDKEKKYLQSRIKTAERVEQIRQEKLGDIAKDEKYEPPAPDVSPDGIEGFSDLKLPGKQTSGNGCWSCAYTLLLKSRGVNMSQEEVRAWRPDYDKNTAKEDKANPSRQYSMNTDSINSVFENADLLGTVLPNTGMKQLTINPADTAEILIGGKPLNKDQAKIVDDYYKAQAKELLRKTVTDAIKNSRSPVATVYKGHYVTITGIAPDGRLRIENSSRHLSNPTQIITLDDVINDSLAVNRSNTTTRSVGLQLTWLQDLDTPSYEKKAEEKTELRKEEPDLVKTDASGNVKIDVPPTHPKSSGAGNPKDGYVIGSNITSTIELDQSGLEKQLGSRIENFDKGRYFIGSSDEYYPKKVFFKGDPDLKRQVEEYRKENLLKDYSFFENAASDFLGSSEEGAEKVNERTKAFREALNHIAEAIEHSQINNKPLDRGLLAQDFETLKGLQEFFCSEQENGKTGLENVQGIIGIRDRNRFYGRMRDIGSVFPEIGLDIDKALLATEKSRQERRARGELIEDFALTQAHNIRMNFSLEQAKNAKTPEKRQQHLSEAVARYHLWMQGRMNGEGNPDISTDHVKELAETIRNSETFRNVMANGNDEVLASKKDLNELIGELSAEYQVVKDREKQAQAEAERERRKEASRKEIYENITKLRGQEVLNAAEGLKSTLAGTYLSNGTGKYWGGIISRQKNSDEYEAMLKTIDKFNHTPNSDTLRETVDSVMEYLKGKETPRETGTGKVRWERCMQFLAEAMPRDEFDKYCHKINTIRKAAPGSEHYVSSEVFRADGISVKSNMDAIRGRIDTKEVTKRDFARIIAMHELYEKPVVQSGEYRDMDEFMKFQPDRDKLVKKTSEIMKRDDFKALMNKPVKELMGLVDQKGCMVLKDYRQLLPKQPFIEQPDKAQPKKGKGVGKTEKPVRQGP